MNDTIPLKFRCLAAAIHAIAAIPVTGVLISLIMWMIVKDLHPFMDQSGRDAINCAVNTLIGMMLSALLCGFVFFVTCGTGSLDPTLVFLSFIILCGVSMCYLLNSLVAGIYALRGYRFQSRLVYPFLRD